MAPKQIILWSHGRTACHLLERMLFTEQPNTKFVWHPHAIARPTQIAMFTEESVAAGMPENTRDPYLKDVEAGNKQWKEALKEAGEKGEILLVHEHPQFSLRPDRTLAYLTNGEYKSTPNLPNGENMTLLPDSIMLHPNTVPIISFRHPALTVPAAYQALRDHEISLSKSNFLLISHLTWQYHLYNYYVAHGFSPIVVEADDYMYSASYTKKIAEAAGLDPEACIFEWKAATDAEIKEMHPMYVKLQQTLIKSTGLVSAKVRKEVKVDVEYQTWRKEYGGEGAELIREAVMGNMPGYEELHRVRLEGGSH